MVALVASSKMPIWRFASHPFTLLCRQNHIQKSTIFRVFKLNSGLHPFTYKDVVKTSGAERQSGGQLGHGFEPIHIQGCRQNHVKNQRFVVFLTPVWIHSYTMMSPKHVPKSSKTRIWRLAPHLFLYKDFVTNTFKIDDFSCF